ncbi:MAG: hypothetical protein FWD16_06795, partial [Clostridia bacterium]|nr:hypothetical protein [Clostridia bacterium]
DMEKTAILECFSGGPIFGYERVGGIMGEGGPEIARCAFVCNIHDPENQDGFSAGLVTRFRHGGGIIGLLADGSRTGAVIRDCYAHFTADSGLLMEALGGLVGSISNYPFSISQCWSSFEYFGPSVKQWANAFYQNSASTRNFKLDKIYYDIERNRLDPNDEFAQVYPCFLDLHAGKKYPYPGEYKALLTGDMNYKNNFGWLDFEEVWDIEDGDTYPFLRALRKTAADLNLSFEDMIVRVGNFPITPTPEFSETPDTPTPEPTGEPTVTTTVAGFTSPTQSAPPPPTTKGDIDGDGYVNIADILMIRDFIFGLEPTAEQLEAVRQLQPEGEIGIMTILAVRDIIFGL